MRQASCTKTKPCDKLQLMKSDTVCVLESFAMEKQSKRKDLPMHGLEKIPVEALLKLSRQEVGQWASYAQELEERNQALAKDLQKKEKRIEQLEQQLADLQSYRLTAEDKRELKLKLSESSHWKVLENQVENLKEQVRKLTKLNAEYMNRICQLNHNIPQEPDCKNSQAISQTAL